jgi:hypothetical protein
MAASSDLSLAGYQMGSPPAYYLTEFEYRANLRKDGDKFGKTLKAMLEAPTMPYKELIASMPASSEF